MRSCGKLDHRSRLNQARFASFVDSIRKPGILLPNLTAAVLLAVVKLTTAISLGALVFSGSLAPYLPTGIGLFLVGTAVGGILTAAGSGFKAVIAGPRSGQAPILAVMASAVAVTMAGQPGESVAATAVASILVATIFTGLVLFALGWAKLGVMVRYIPYPVMGGFFAGLGFLLLKGGIVVTLGSVAGVEEPSSFMTATAAIHLAPALLFAIAYYVCTRYFDHWLLMPAFLLVSMLLFYAALFVTGTSVASAAGAGWLPVVDTSRGDFFPVLSVHRLGLIDWSVVLGQSGTILVMALMSMIMLLLDTSGVEIILNRDMDPNHELRTAGWANVLNGLCTGPIAILSATDTAFTYKLGGDRFVMVAAFALVIVAAIMVGPGPIAFAPKAILGGLLIFLGIDFLMKWVWQSRRKLPVTDYAVICGILLVVAFYGILHGVAIGIGLSIFLFVHSYSQISVIKSSMSGAEHVSSIDRNPRELNYLDEHAVSIQICVLQGFLFFGTSSRLLEEIRALLDEPERAPVRYLLLDFRRVDALDTSSANSFAKLMQICAKRDISLIMTGCSPKVAHRLKNLDEEASASQGIFHIMDNLDDGVSWCEDRILEGVTDDDDGQDLGQLLGQLLGRPEAARLIASKFERLPVKRGQVLFRQGDPGDALYLVLDGSVSIVLDLPGGKELHLRTMRSGAILGEMALYTGATRSATARVKVDGLFYKLKLTSYERFNEEHPAEAVFFHLFIVKLMSERLGRANREIMALSR
ncbi:MAG: STAS domain-containing protein [Proteobacteria bacterium]|nr:MAG: STAS domain-containing protein [Pseudomonadota bacterium]